LSAPASTARRKAESAGRWGEWAAGALLLAKGYALVGRRVRTGAGEIDLIARRGRWLAFVEVKTRPRGAGVPVLARRQRERIERAASLWCAGRAWTGNVGWRYDLVCVSPWRLPVHIPDAWRPESDPALSPAGPWRQGGARR
jgi:putative endonuclease